MLPCNSFMHFAIQGLSPFLELSILAAFSDDEVYFSVELGLTQ